MKETHGTVAPDTSSPATETESRNVQQIWTGVHRQSTNPNHTHIQHISERNKPKTSFYANKYAWECCPHQTLLHAKTTESLNVHPIWPVAHWQPTNPTHAHIQHMSQRNEQNYAQHDIPLSNILLKRALRKPTCLSKCLSPWNLPLSFSQEVLPPGHLSRIKHTNNTIL